MAFQVFVGALFEFKMYMTAVRSLAVKNASVIRSQSNINKSTCVSQSLAHIF